MTHQYHLKHSPWRICLSASLFFFFVFLQLNLINAMSTELMASFNISDIQLGELSASYFLGIGLFFIPAGLLLDKLSTRRIILISMAVEILFIILFALSPSYHCAMFTRLISGCIHAIAFLGCIRLASRWLSHRLGLAVGLIVTIGLCGGIVAQVPMVKLVGMIGWREVIAVTALLGVIILILQWLFVADYPHQTEKDNNSHFWRNLYHVILNKQNWLCSLYTALLNLPVVVLGAVWGDIFLTHENHITKSQAALIMSMVYAGNIISSPFIGFISDKLNRRKIVMIAGAILALCIIAPITLASGLSFTMLLFLFLLLGLVISAQSISYPTVSESNPLSYTGIAIGFASSIIMGSAIVFQPLFGWLIEQTWQLNLFHIPFSSYRIAFAMIPIGFILSLICAFFVKETYCENQEESSA